MQHENYRARILWGQGVVQTRASQNTGMVGNRKNFRRPSVREDPKVHFSVGGSVIASLLSMRSLSLSLSRSRSLSLSLSLSDLI